MTWTRWSCLILLAGFLAAQPPLELKGLRGGRPVNASGQYAGRRRSGSCRHIVVQFKQQPSRAALQLLRQRDASILEYVPQFGYVLSAPDGILLADLDLQWFGSLAAHEKLSPELKENPASRTSFAVVEFYPDVVMADARALVVDAQLQIHENPDLLDHDLLVSGPPGAFLALAQWDDVEYIFPASNDLVQGRSVNACPGALSDQGQLGQSIPKVGRWASVGDTTSLQYAFVNVTEKLPSEAAEAEIVRALSTWSKYVQVNWSETSDTSADRTVAIMFGRHAHGDAWPFDGPGGVLAHTFYPYPVSSEPIAGNMHFDDDENWRIGPDTDLFSVALHEAGHALGLGHSDIPGAVMYPYYQKATDLSPEDIAAIQTLYASQTGTTTTPAQLVLTVTDPGATTSSPTLNLSGSTSGGVAPTAITWVTDAQISGTATGSNPWAIRSIPLHAGANTITIGAADARKVSVTQTLSINYVKTTSTQPPPTLQILAPVTSGTFTTTSASVLLSGTASDSSGIKQVTWATSSGTSGLAVGTSDWNAASIQLTASTTQIAVTALAGDGQTASQSIQVNYTPSNPTDPSGGSGPGPSPPSLTILDPAITTLTVTTPCLSVSGTAASTIGISTVTWSSWDGDSGTATGTSQWTIPAIPLLIGTNTLTIRAYDTSGASSWRSLVVTRMSSN